MIFLNPAVLIGLLAASIPILIHLLNLRKLKKVEFSTLTFLKELQKNKIRKVKIKQWLLLILRVAIILFVVFTFSRPTLQGISIGGATSAAKTTAVFIFDDTFSMSVSDQNGSYFNQAKVFAKKLLSNLQDGDEVGLIKISDDSDNISLTSDFSEFETMLENLNISFVSSKIHSAFVKAAQVISESKNFNKEIYILSDFQYGQLADDETVSELNQLLDNNVKVYTVSFAGKDVFNLSIDSFISNTSIFEKDRPVSFSATVTNHSLQPVNNAVVSLYLNEERTVQQSVSIASGESKIIEIEAVPKETGYISAVAELEDDDIEFDNKRYLNFYIPEKIPLLISADNQNDLHYLELAISTANISGSYYLKKINSNQLNVTNPDEFNVILFTGKKLFPAADRIKDFVEHGGGVLIFPASEVDLDGFNRMLSGLGLVQSEKVIVQPESKSNPIFIEKSDIEHPLFQNIFQEEDRIDFESPEFYTYYRILPGENGRSIITLQDGSSFLTEFRIGDGKILLFNSAPVLTWNSFPLKGIFPALINKSITYLAAKDHDGIDYIAGDQISINIRNAKVPQLNIIQPDNTEDFISLTGTERGDILSYRNTKLAGHYKVFSGDKLLKDFSVNTDPAESVSEYLSPDEIKSYLNKINFTGHVIMIDKSDDPSEVILQARFGSELWKYFLLIAILLALIEMTIARNAKKELEGLA